MPKTGNDKDVGEGTDELELEANSLETGKGKKKPKKPDTRYHRSLAYVFNSHHKPGLREIPFKREELTAAGKKLKLKPLKNLGDAIYSYRYRIPLPQEITSTAPEGYSWVIMPAGK